MVAEGTVSDAESPSIAARSRAWRGRRGDLLARLAVFATAGGTVIAYALPGGAYDIVVRQEYGLVIWAVVAFGFAFGLLPRARPSRATLLVLAALLAYTAWVGISLAWSESAERTTAELARSLDYLGLCVLFASVIDRRLWRAAITGLGAGALIVCAVAVASRLFPSAFPANVVGVAFDTDRLSYPFGYWNTVAAWGAMSIALALSWSANDGSRLRRMLMLGGAPVAGTMVYLSYSRAGVAGAAVAVVAAVGLSRHRWTAAINAAIAGAGTALAIAVIRTHVQIAHGSGSRGFGAVLAALVFASLLCSLGAWLCMAVGTDRWRLSQTSFRVIGTACAIVVLVAGVAFGPGLASRVWHQFRNPALPPAGSNPTERLTTLSGTRYNLWAVAVDAFTARPLTGTGAGTYQFWWDRHERDSESVINAHSIWFETMAELGVPGLIAIVAFLGSAVALLLSVRRRSRRRKSAAASTAATAAFIVFLLHASVDWMWQSTAVTILALGGLMAAGARLSAGRVTFRWWARAGLALLAAAAAAFQLPGVLSTLDVRHSQAAERHGDGGLGLAWAQAAVNAEPWAATSYDQLGLVRESAGQLRAAAAALRRAIDREPTNYAHWLLLARVQIERGRIVSAARDYARAHELLRRGQVFSLPLPQSVVEPAGG
jgi:hypothetical protein